MDMPLNLSAVSQNPQLSILAVLLWFAFQIPWQILKYFLDRDKNKTEKHECSCQKLTSDEQHELVKHCFLCEQLQIEQREMSRIIKKIYTMVLLRHKGSIK